MLIESRIHISFAKQSKVVKHLFLSLFSNGTGTRTPTLPHYPSPYPTNLGMNHWLYLWIERCLTNWATSGLAMKQLFQLVLTQIDTK